MKSFIYLSRYNRSVFTGLVKGAHFQNLKLLRAYVTESLEKWAIK